MGKLQVNQLSKTFAGSDHPALQDVSFTVDDGEIVALLGPSGCGKTTTLRCIAGLEHPDSGTILVDGEEITNGARHSLPPERRGMGMVFQSYSIWPHMTVGENIALGLRAKKMNRSQVKQKVEEVLALVRLGGLADRPATDLSGGQQQRVALARSLALEPRVLLFDEPLSNLDANLREEMRFELRELLQRLGITSVYVTHDQAEAFVICDKICAMHAGRLVQVGHPEEIYCRPATRFVAEFIGAANVLSGTVRGAGQEGLLVDIGDNKAILARGAAAPGQEVELCLRAEAIRLSPQEGRPPSEHTVEGKVVQRVYLGGARQYRVDLGAQSVRVTTTPAVRLDEGQPVWVEIKPEDALVLAAEPSGPGNSAVRSVAAEARLSVAS